jgi:hypothetical protein
MPHRHQRQRFLETDFRLELPECGQKPCHASNRSPLPAAHAALHTIRALSSTSLDKLCAKHALVARKHPVLPIVQLSYTQRGSDMRQSIPQECRGLIIEKDSHRVVCLPFTKFFNALEPNAPSSFDWSTARAYEKIDGSLMALYHYAGQWHVASSKLPAADGLVPHTKATTFANAFWRAWRAAGYQLPARKDCNYMFELALPEHCIVVRHAEATLTLIGARDVETLEELDCETIASVNGWRSAPRLDFGGEGACAGKAASLEAVREAARALNPVEHEGFVVVDANFRRLKIKSPGYVALHHMRGNPGSASATVTQACREGTIDARLRRRRLLEIALNNESHEFLTYYPDLRPEYLEVARRLRTLCALLTEPMQGQAADRPLARSHKGPALAPRGRADGASVMATLREAADGKLRAQIEAAVDELSADELLEAQIFSPAVCDELEPPPLAALSQASAARAATASASPKASREARPAQQKVRLTLVCPSGVGKARGGAKERSAVIVVDPTPGAIACAANDKFRLKLKQTEKLKLSLCDGTLLSASNCSDLITSGTVVRVGTGKNPSSRQQGGHERTFGFRLSPESQLSPESADEEEDEGGPECDQIEQDMFLPTPRMLMSNRFHALMVAGV